MGGKSKAESQKKPPRRKLTAEEQHALFVEAARELGVEEVGEEFERVFDDITRFKRQPVKGRS
jgi:hypothetical protein